jgi:hypothetical protein
MVRSRLAPLAFALACVLPAQAQPAPVPTDGVERLLAHLEKLLLARDLAGVAPLVSPDASFNSVLPFFADLMSLETSRVVVRERDRSPLPGASAGQGYRIVIEVFFESATRGRIITARLDVQRLSHVEDVDVWRFLDVERLSLVDGLHRLGVNPHKQFAARNLVLRSEDLQITVQEGSAFVVETSEGVTGLVLFGSGEMRFSPGPETERGQVRIFAGSETLISRFGTAFVRLNPYDFEARVDGESLVPVSVDSRQLRRAQGVFVTDAPRSFSLDLADLSRDTWYLLPGVGDFLAEVHTRRHGDLTFARASNEAEDVTLFDRQKQRTIALYASTTKLITRGRFYDEDDLSEYDVLDHNIDATLWPDRGFIEGRARMRVRVRAYALATMTIRLADALSVASVVSSRFGRLLHVRVRNQNSVVVNFPEMVRRGEEMTLQVGYSGRLPSQNIDREALEAGARSQRSEEFSIVSSEPSYLLSNRAYWYPQSQVTDYATATLRISVPEGFGCVASGELAEGSPVSLRDSTMPQGTKKLYVFVAPEPLRYLAVVISRFSRVSAVKVPTMSALGGAAEGEPRLASRDRVTLTVDTNPRQQGRGREMAEWASDILRFYSSLMGDAPYPAMSLAIVENELPGGHSPGYFAMLNNPPPATPFVWRNDPANFSGFPEFFLAHEIAHQWWGQAVGWKNYHEQWISEGFAQYFAALYAEKARGTNAFTDMLRQFRRWALAESDQGPVYLGYRLGHIKGDSRVFRALLYNKGAAVLHMLRRLTGDEVFFTALRKFYDEQRFQKAGTNDLERAFEAETGKSWERFFDRWIFGSALPRLRYQTIVGDGAVTVRFRQAADLVFDIPVTVTITYTDGRATEVVVPVTDVEVERTIQVDGAVRNVQINRDGAAIAHFDES